MKSFWTLYLFCLVIGKCSASVGDRTQYFQNCWKNCRQENCTSDGVEILSHAVAYYGQSFFDKTLGWTCSDECEQSCMWLTVDIFKQNDWPVPQFYGKWPFIRFMGLQEPASVLFSLLNLVVHYQMLRKFRLEVRPDSPCYMLWHAFSLTCINGWIWSIIFHSRDFPLTELLDYAFAYSMVLVCMYCMAYRMLFNFSRFVRGVVSVLFLSFYCNYFVYLGAGKFSYSFNMKVNVITGILSAVCWLTWVYFVRHRRPYAKSLIRFYMLVALTMSFELLDFPPILWIIDAHSLWHLCTAPITTLFYGFIIDDCKSLRKDIALETYSFNKEI